MKTLLLSFALLLACALANAAEPEQSCITPEQVANFIGKNVCVKGKVLDVGMSRAGTYFLDFCEDRYHCPFTAVSFPHSSKRIGDLRVLKNHIVELRGKVRDYKGQPEIVINSRDQIKSDAIIPEPPSEFRAETGDPASTGQRRSKRDRAW